MIRSITFHQASTTRFLMENKDPLIIKGIRIEPDVLRKDAVVPCAGANCKAACCSTGVWLKEDEAPRIRAWATAVKACLPAERHDESKWFDADDLEPGTTTVDDPMRPGKTCCVFLQPDRKCALQVVSKANNLGWPGLKPYFCAIFPLYFEEGVLSMDEHPPLDFSATGGEKRAMYEVYRDEAILILGEDGYRELSERVGKTPE
jgi:Fe-S-cluster containining protein